ncbi:undecaprenyl-diphosphate phosphatase [Polaromonas sp.]|nr:undecaprenyl-diphosphate phosphatase [Candidatus Saccharibacteria bacterium]
MPIFLIAIILGLLEGVTEFLPISSTGHLLVAERLTNFKDVQDIFTVVIQLGAIAAVIWFYRLDLISKVRGLFARDPQALNFWKLLIIATIPAGLIGLALDKSLASLGTPTVIAWALIIGGVILWVVDHRPVVTGNDTLKPHIEKLTTKQALIVGFGQAVAVIPGVSRSGATIVSGLSLGIDRPTATAFSFYLGIPILVLASALKLVKHPDAISQISGGASTVVIGLVCAFITALLSIGWLLRYVSRHNFRPFAYYRIALGILILLFVK